MTFRYRRLISISLFIIAAIVSLSLPIIARTRYLRLPVRVYRDRMMAGWIGQMDGVAQGAPTEFRYSDRIIPDAEMPKWTSKFTNDAFWQDDLYVEMTFLHSLEQYGLDVSIRQAGLDFANSQ